MTLLYLGSSILHNDACANKKNEKKTMKITNYQWFTKMLVYLHIIPHLQVVEILRIRIIYSIIPD